MNISKEEMFKNPDIYFKQIVKDPVLWEEFQIHIKNQEVQPQEVRPWDLFNPSVERASEEEAEVRYSICQKCPSFIKITKQCKECGCFMKAKVKIKAASCPLGKW